VGEYWENQHPKGGFGKDRSLKRSCRLLRMIYAKAAKARRPWNLTSCDGAGSWEKTDIQVGCGSGGFPFSNWRVMRGRLSCGVCLGAHGESFAPVGEGRASGPREKAEGDIEGEALFLPVCRGEDGISGGGGGAVFGGNDSGGSPGGLRSGARPRAKGVAQKT
jgi:hypothetical protein